jgi:DNA-binding MarR family transcriptional regulator
MAVDRAAEHRALAARVWRQVFELFVRTRGQRDHVLQRLRLSPNDAKTLCMLDAVAKPMRALADACSTDASNATWVVDRLEGQGLVERRSVPGDRRVKLVGLTARGVKARSAIMDAMHEPPLEVLALDRADLVAMANILQKIPLLADTPEPILASAAAAPSPVAPAAGAPRATRGRGKSTQRT